MKKLEYKSEQGIRFATVIIMAWGCLFCFLDTSWVVGVKNVFAIFGLWFLIEIILFFLAQLIWLILFYLVKWIIDGEI